MYTPAKAHMGSIVFQMLNGLSSQDNRVEQVFPFLKIFENNYLLTFLKYLP